MPYNAGGSTTRTTKTSGGTTWASDASASNPINAAEFDTETADIYAMLAKCITADGNQTVTADIPMNSKKITGLGTPSASTDAATKAYADSVYVGYTAFKAATTARSSTTTLADDPNLTAAITAAGTYIIEVWMSYGTAAPGSQGLKVQLNFTGTTTYSSTTYYGVNNIATTMFYANSGTPLGTPLTLVGAGQGSVTEWVYLTGLATVSTSGTFSVQWAQVNSSGNSTSVGQGSYMKLRKIA